MKKSDILIAGGGPAGLYAAYEAGKRGLKSIVIEKDDSIGEPILCAEGISNRTLSKFLPEDDYKFIRNRFNMLKIIYKDKISMTSIPDMGLIIDRGAFDRYISGLAVKYGAELLTSEEVMKAGASDNAMLITDRCEYRGELIIAADGVESNVGHMCGIDTVTELNDIYSCYQYVLEDASIDDNEIVFDFTPEYANGGYVWIFPRGNKQANFGIGINPAISDRKAKAVLEDYRKRFYPDARIIREMTGAVPVNPISRIYSDRVMVSGDASRYADPLTGGGIDNALRTSRFAAITAEKAFKIGDFSASMLSGYDVMVRRDNGFAISRQLKLRAILDSMSEREQDEFYISLLSFLEGREMLSDDFYNTILSLRSTGRKMSLAVRAMAYLIKERPLMKVMMKLI